MILPETTLSIPYTDDLEATDKGLVISGKPDFLTWHALWQWLKDRDRAMPWILGDMLIYGESAFGEAVSQVLDGETEQEHFKPGTLRDYKYVAKKFPLSSRLYAVPWSYYQTVAGLPLEQAMALLQHCNEFDIKRSELRQKARELNGGKEPNPPTNPDDTIEELRQENYHQEQRIAELESQLEQPIISPEFDDSYSLPPDSVPEVDNLARPIIGWLDSVGYSAVIIRRNGEIVIKP